MTKSIRYLSLTAVMLIGSITPVTAQKKLKSPRPPVLIRNTEAVIAPGMSIELEAFYPDGLPDITTEVQFVFLQDGERLTTRRSGDRSFRGSHTDF